MKIWFQCKIKYHKEEESGKLKKVTEPYLVDAVSYTEAEARIYQELGSVIRGDFEVTSLTKSKIIDIFHYDDSDTWYQCKVVYTVTDDDSGKEKKVTNLMLVTAGDLREAYDRLVESLGTLLVTYKITEIKESPIVEIFPYYEERPNEMEPEKLTENEAAAVEATDVPEEEETEETEEVEEEISEENTEV